MNVNNIPVAFEISVTTSVSQSTNTNDIVDLTETNDGDECEEIFCYPPVVPENSLHLQHPRRPASNDRITVISKAPSASADDSISILYENIQPAPEILVVNEIVNESREQNQSAGHDLNSIPVPPIMLGAHTEEPLSAFLEIPPIFPEISNEIISSSYQPINYSTTSHTSVIQHSNLPSCKYATVLNENSSQSFIMPHIELARAAQSVRVVPSNLKNDPVNQLEPSSVPSNPSHDTVIERENIMNNLPKIQCGICLDGHEEIAASDRNFTSTNCGHIFCNTCIKTSMRNQAKCPKCRKRITAKSIHPLYI